MSRLVPILLVLAASGSALPGLTYPGIIQGGIAMAADEAWESSGPGHTDPLPGPRDPEIAVREEFDAAVAAGSADGLRLFIERHRGHPLAQEAQRALDQLRAAERPE